MDDCRVRRSAPRELGIGWWPDLSRAEKASYVRGIYSYLAGKTDDEVRAEWARKQVAADAPAQLAQRMRSEHLRRQRITSNAVRIGPLRPAGPFTAKGRGTCALCELPTERVDSPEQRKARQHKYEEPLDAPGGVLAMGIFYGI